MLPFPTQEEDIILGENMRPRRTPCLAEGEMGLSQLPIRHRIPTAACLVLGN